MTASAWQVSPIAERRMIQILSGGVCSNILENRKIDNYAEMLKANLNNDNLGQLVAAYNAEELKLVYTYAPAIGYSNELIHIFSAHNLKKVSEKIDEEEIQSVERIGLERLEELIKLGFILDGKTLIGLSLLGLLTDRALI